MFDTLLTMKRDIKEKALHRYAEVMTGNKYYKEWGRRGEHIVLNNGQIIRKENAYKFLDQIIEEAFVDNI